jgi:hypothetical protein
VANNAWMKETSSRISVSSSLAVSSTASATTAAFGAQTYQIRVAAVTTGAFVNVGDGSPSAASSSAFIPANQFDYFTVTPGQKLVALGQAGAGSVIVTEMQ